MKFSERLRITPKKAIQLKSMDDDLRNGLWNIFYSHCLEDIRSYGEAKRSPQFPVFRTIWSEHFIMHTDNIPYQGSRCIEKIKYRYFNCDWNKIYDFFEFLFGLPIPNLETLIRNCNAVLEKEKAGYRVVVRQITPITDEQEMAEIEKAIAESGKLNQSAVKDHLENALNKLADRQEPDYRNSIKESISAVESLVRVIISDPKKSLGDALNLIDQKIKIHPALKEGFKKIFGYTSDADGIRHAMTEDSKCELEDAQYMLISCSAFINYLIVKANKAGIKL